MKTVKLIPMVLVWCSIVSSLFAHKEMTFSELKEQHYKSWHLELFDRVMQATAILKENQQTNFFAVKLVIYYQDLSLKILNLVIDSSGGIQDNKDTHKVLSNNFPIIAENVFKYLNDYNLLDLLFEYNEEKKSFMLKENDAKKLLPRGNALEYLLKKRELLTFQEKLRYFILKNKIPFRTKDSEAIFLTKILKDKIVKDSTEVEGLKNILERKDVSRIEIHGFTTRDMCPCCYQHMRNAIQWLQYTYQIPIFAYISSLVKLSEDTLKFVPYQLQDTLAEKDHLTCIFFRQEYATDFTFENVKQLTRTLNLLKRDDNSIEEVFSIKDTLLNMLDGDLRKIINEDGVQSYIQNTDFSKTQQSSSEPHQQSIADQIRSQGFEIRNVTGDGNCGAYALLQGLVYNENARNQAKQSLQQNLNAQDFFNVLTYLPLDGYGNISPNDNVWKVAQALRQLLPEDNPSREMATQGEMNRWITDDNLQTFSNELGINIVLISGQNGNRIFIPNAANNPAQQQTLEGVLSFARENNAVILYHKFNHYQTVINAQNQ